MLLRQLVPPLEDGFVNTLQEIDLKTDADLLLTDDAINIFTRLPAGHGVSLRDFHHTLAQVADIASAPAVYGDKLFEQDAKRREDIFSDDMLLGVPDVDALIGGFSPPRVVEISGDAGSGKTALALQVAVRHLSRVEDSSVLWVDSTGEFSPERVALVLERSHGPYASTALERLQVCLAFEIEAAHEVLETLRQSLTNPPGQTHIPSVASPTTRCIVIDSITSLLGPMLSATSSQGHAIMTTFMRQLRAFAESFSITVIIINNSTRVNPMLPDGRNPETVFETGRKPALGPSFTFTTDATLWLSRRAADDSWDGGEPAIYAAEVLRSKITRSKTWAQFSIKDGTLAGV